MLDDIYFLPFEFSIAISLYGFLSVGGLIVLLVSLFSLIPKYKSLEFPSIVSFWWVGYLLLSPIVVSFFAQATNLDEYEVLQYWVFFSLAVGVLILLLSVRLGKVTYLTVLPILAGFWLWASALFAEIVASV
ncbi:MAG: hypothetical protein ACSHYB_07195 [Roseibacillus sp.]